MRDRLPAPRHRHVRELYAATTRKNARAIRSPTSSFPIRRSSMLTRPSFTALDLLGHHGLDLFFRSKDYSLCLEEHRPIHHHPFSVHHHDHIGPYPDQVNIDSIGPHISYLWSLISTGGDLFFSAHTGLPFLMGSFSGKIRRYVISVSLPRSSLGSWSCLPLALYDRCGLRFLHHL